MCNIDRKLTRQPATTRHAVLRPGTRLSRSSQAMALVVSGLVGGNLTSDGQEKSALLVVVVGGMQENGADRSKKANVLFMMMGTGCRSRACATQSERHGHTR